MATKKYKSFKEFYPYYLSEHRDTTCRILHFIGTTCFFSLLALAIYYRWTWQWIFLPISGYGFAWVGHFFFEKNKPATFQYPLWSLASDFKLYFELWGGKDKFRTND